MALPCSSCAYAFPALCLCFCAMAVPCPSCACASGPRHCCGCFLPVLSWAVPWGFRVPGPLLGCVSALLVPWPPRQLRFGSALAFWLFTCQLCLASAVPLLCLGCGLPVPWLCQGHPAAVPCLCSAFALSSSPIPLPCMCFCLRPLTYASCCCCC